MLAVCCSLPSSPSSYSPSFFLGAAWVLWELTGRCWVLCKIVSSALYFSKAGRRGSVGAGNVPFQTDLLSKHRVGCIATAIWGFGLRVSVWKSSGWLHFARVMLGGTNLLSHGFRVVY